MLKRERSPEGTDAGADRPSKRAAGEHILATSTSGNTSRQHSEDWVRQAGGLRIDGSAVGNYMFTGVSQGIGVAGPGPSTLAQVDDDFAMAVEDTVGVSPFQEERHESPSFAQQQPSNPQLFLPQRSLSLPNPSAASRHPYGHHWVERVRNADGGPLINVLPATPAVSQQSLAIPEAPTGPGVEHHHHPQSAQNHLLQAPRAPSGTPPLSDPTGMSSSTPPLVHDLSSSTGKNKRVAFGPRLDCEKCRQGEIHFAHVHYE